MINGLQEKQCSSCKAVLPVTLFYIASATNRPRPYCKPCENRQRGERRRKAGPLHDERARRYTAKLSAMRRSGQQVARWILADSRGSDRKHGRENTLTLNFIESAIANGCTYCGETSLRMTLDRMDNATGHTPENVLAACIRCNYLRRHTPYAAWLEIVPSVRAAREKDLFGEWDGRCR